jgi:hypothetical protein
MQDLTSDNKNFIVPCKSRNLDMCFSASASAKLGVEADLTYKRKQVQNCCTRTHVLLQGGYLG